jgi:hypothetical protein
MKNFDILIEAVRVAWNSALIERTLNPQRITQFRKKELIVSSFITPRALPSLQKTFNAL